ncbi:MAG: hypothetical protein HYU34_03320 [Candidatus Omnitrophica bacterium]|nr:hypothetical protein [Candidatus Omnitrophota bacterium]
MKVTFWMLITSLTLLSAPMGFAETASPAAGEEAEETELAADEEGWWDDLEEGEGEAETEGFGDETALDEDSPLKPVKAEEAVPATAKK